MKIFILIVLVFASAHIAESRKLYKPCELARYLLANGIPRASVVDWLCMAYYESSYRTWIVGPPNSDGSRDYGLFQINSGLWCKAGSPGNKCGVSCESVATDDISIALACAKKIHAAQGFSAWVGWKKHCKGHSFLDLANVCSNI